MSSQRLKGSLKRGRRSSLDERLQQMLSELRRALYDAISDSNEVHRTWRILREEGYSLYLMVDCKRQPGEEETGKLMLAAEAPTFQINRSDLAFLKSIGIDPTRRARRRRSSST